MNNIKKYHGIESKEARARTASNFISFTKNKSLTKEIAIIKAKYNNIPYHQIFMMVIDRELPEFQNRIYVPDEDFAIYTQLISALGPGEGMEIIQNGVENLSEECKKERRKISNLNQYTAMEIQ